VFATSPPRVYTPVYTQRKLEAFRELAAAVLDYSENQMTKFVNEGVFIPVQPPKEESNAPKIP
jgi:hypothetical protein